MSKKGTELAEMPASKVVLDHIEMGRYYHSLAKRPEQLRLWREFVKALNRDGSLRLSMVEAQMAATMMLENDNLQADLMEIADDGNAAIMEKIHKMISKNREMLLDMFNKGRITAPPEARAQEAADFLTGIEESEKDGDETSEEDEAVVHGEQLDGSDKDETGRGTEAV